jgi:formylglycine-generating enzyme required for sulfatase activity
MVELTSPNGTRYCIDRTEVTQGHYAEFLSSFTIGTEVPKSDAPECAENVLFPHEDLASIEGSFCHDGKIWTPDLTPNRPVTCIDWCDAYSYCASAGKRLCGKIGGGGITTSAPMIDADQSQWYNACSQGGTTVYPYGNTYDPKACEGADPAPNWAAKEDVASSLGCHGSSEPFASIFDLSGSAAELTDECETDPGSGWVQCIARGGAYATEAGMMRCDLGANWSRDRYDEWVGFRCCKDL